MVSLENKFELREFFIKKVDTAAKKNIFLSCFLSYLNLSLPPEIEISSLTTYERCIINGLLENQFDIDSDLLRLFGQAAIIDGTPRLWVMDIFGLLSLKLYLNNLNSNKLNSKFGIWINSFLPSQINKDHFNLFEKDIAHFVVGEKNNINFKTATVPLFLHYIGNILIYDNKLKTNLIQNFLSEFQQYALEKELSENTIAILIYVFDKSSKDVTIVPPNGWSFDDLSHYLNQIPSNLRRWTWESKARTSGGDIVRWYINNEYHVQNLLYTLLAPIFCDLREEENLPSIGQKKPRIDLYLPSLHTIIEVKYRKNNKKSFSELIGEIGEDASLYLSSKDYSDAKIIVFLWDHTKSVQEHALFKSGILGISGINACIVASAPSFFEE
ncbi:hypothetical protein [uncultured Acinetobacter sp.]|uniref:PD-(D/E)XK nuclease domain-containing protein n=1 Tax=uncultured Acinetobacter sp. TaxID=165433 RepID=UPI002585DFEE|nr:hypothetical protein [uncultured Acinetobacter sp.]